MIKQFINNLKNDELTGWQVVAGVVILVAVLFPALYLINKFFIYQQS